MERWTARAAGGMSQRLYPRGATVRSRSSSDIRTTPSSRRRCDEFATRSRLQPRWFWRVGARFTQGSRCIGVRYDPPVMRRALPLLLLTLTVALVLAPVAFGHDGGEGTYGETNDKVVTNAGFILIA